MKKIILLIFFTCASVFCYSQQIKVRLFTNFNIKTIVVRLTEGKYELTSEGEKQFKLRKNNIIYFTVIGDSISAWDLDQHIGMFSSVSLVNRSKKNEFRIEPAYPSLPERKYEGDLHLRVKDSIIYIINKIDLENYVAGVVESEGGPKAPFEFYKSQAIICRTYALDHLDRHIAEGYHLCDEVHCQVYKSKVQYNDSINDATLATKGMVITDTAFQLITAAFHSNSGGQTINSEDVWSSATSYLKAVHDTFAFNQRNYIWRDSILIQEWLAYLDTIGKGVSKHPFSRDELVFEQNERSKYLIINGDSIPLKKIRNDLKLRSTYFSTSVNGDYLVFHGKGYGHGVGLSQESAMHMARMGYSYYEIITFFYQNIRIVNVEYLDIPFPSEKL